MIWVIEKLNARLLANILKQDNDIGMKIIRFCQEIDRTGKSDICSLKSYTHSKWKLLLIENERLILQESDNYSDGPAYRIIDENWLTLVLDIDVSKLRIFI